MLPVDVGVDADPGDPGASDSDSGSAARILSSLSFLAANAKLASEVADATLDGGGVVCAETDGDGAGLRLKCITSSPDWRHTYWRTAASVMSSESSWSLQRIS